MKIKHKLIQDFQYVSPDKKIFVLKSGTILEEYNYKFKSEIIPIDKDLIDANPQFFELIDWRAELMSFMKVNKMPQPAQLGKKLIPFIDEMIMSAIPQSSGPTLDESKIKELEWKEKDLDSRERRIKDKEDEIEIRNKRVEKRESEHKEDLKQLDKKEDELRERSRELTEKQLNLEDESQKIKEKERNLDKEILNSAKDLDEKYTELQNKINKDIESLNQKEKELEKISAELKRKEDNLTQSEADVSDKIRDFDTKVEEFKIWETELRKLDKEIKDWENLHWKFKRSAKPPSAID